MANSHSLNLHGQTVNDFKIFSVSELRRRLRLRRVQMAALLSFGWLSGTLMSQAHDPDSRAPSPLNLAVAAERYEPVSAPPAEIDAACPSLAVNGLHLDCRLSLPSRS